MPAFDDEYIDRFLSHVVRFDALWPSVTAPRASTDRPMSGLEALLDATLSEAEYAAYVVDVLEFNNVPNAFGVVFAQRELLSDCRDRGLELAATVVRLLDRSAA
jgi:hypothetical protein